MIKDYYDFGYGYYSCITVSAQVKYEGINGSFDGMMM
jgi:hypothetical protein